MNSRTTNAEYVGVKGRRDRRVHRRGGAARGPERAAILRGPKASIDLGAVRFWVCGGLPHPAAAWLHKRLWGIDPCEALRSRDPGAR